MNRKISDHWSRGDLKCFRQGVITPGTNGIWIKAIEEQITGIIAVSNFTEIYQYSVELCVIEVGTVLKINFTARCLNLTQLPCV